MTEDEHHSAYYSETLLIALHLKKYCGQWNIVSKTHYSQAMISHNGIFSVI